MLRIRLLVSGLVLLVLGTILSVAPAAADDPPGPTTRLLVNQRVALLPQEPLCWRINLNVLAPGPRSPVEGYTGGPLRLAYVLEGAGQRIEYAGGPTVTHRTGEGLFIGADNWFARTNLGMTPLRTAVFQLTCGPAPGTLVGVTGTLPGVRPMAPHLVQLLEVTGAPGSQTRPQATPGPLTSYFLEGTVAVSTPEGVKQYKAGDILVIPPGTPFQTATVGNTAARALVALLTPVGEPPQIPRADARLPVLGPTALPRTGEEFSWAGPLALFAGVVLLTAGIRLPRAKT